MAARTRRQTARRPPHDVRSARPAVVLAFGTVNKPADHKISCRYLSQEDLLRSGCLDMKLAMKAAEGAMVAMGRGDVLFPEKIVQIFNEETQERINCLPATFLKEKICGVKWVSVFPPNPVQFGLQNLSATIILSEIERGFPIAIMEGTLCSNMRVGAMGGIAAKHLARKDSKSIGFIGSGEQAKMHLIAMKTAVPSLGECRIGAKTEMEERQFIAEMSAILPQMAFVAAGTDLQKAADGADIIVTATSAQAPLLKAAWVKPGAFYSHVGGWEDEYAVAKSCDKIVCDDWDTVKHRTQTLSRMYQDGQLADGGIHANLVDLVTGDKPGRESGSERIYFNAVGLAYTDVAIAHAMFKRAVEAGAGSELTLQECMIFEHPDLKDLVRL
ncbi:alanine dehydrogenase [soil metagenome]